MLRLNRVRADTTVVEANVAYPVDSSLLAKGVARLVRLAVQAQAAGLATRTRVRNRTRSVYRRARDVVNTLRQRGDNARERGASSQRRAGRHRSPDRGRSRRGDPQRPPRPGPTRAPEATGRQRAIVEDLATARRAGRARSPPRPASGSSTVSPRPAPPGSCRCTTPTPAPSPRDASGRPVEFGYKAQLVDNDDGIIVDHNVEAGNPPDAPMLVPAIERIRARTGRAPRAVTADRGYGEAAVEDDLHAAGVALRRAAPQGQTQRRSPPDREPTRLPEAWCDGAPAAKDASAAPNATSVSPEHASTGSPAPAPGSGTASSTTTWSRSPDSPPDHRSPATRESAEAAPPDPAPVTISSSGRSN